MLRQPGTILAFALALVTAGGAHAQLARQQVSAHGVTVSVTPGNVPGDAKVWEFALVLDTHSQDLSDDLAKSAVLVDGAGRRHAPLAWEGAPPGGHHRSGVLKFKPPSPLPPAIELRIERPGEPAARVFRWRLQ